MIDQWKMSAVVILSLLGIIIFSNIIGNTKESFQDEEFMRFVKDSNVVMVNDIKDLGDSYKKNDTKNVEIYARKYKEDSRLFLDKINSFRVSESHKEIFDKYKSYLSNSYNAGSYIEEGYKTNNETAIKIGIDYKLRSDENISLVISTIKNS